MSAPAGPAGPNAQDADFQAWLQGGRDAGPQLRPAPAPDPYAGGAQREELPAGVDPEVANFIRQQVGGVRREVAGALSQTKVDIGDASTRSEMWATFQARHPEFAGEDAFIREVYNEVVAGRVDVPPTAHLRDQLLERVAERAHARLTGLMQKAGYEIEGEDDANRTAGVGDGSLPSPGGKSAPAKPESESSLLTDLVKLQGETEFFPKVEGEALALYGRGNLRSS